MKRPKQQPFVERKGTSAAAADAASVGIQPAGLIGKSATPACRLLADYGCN